MKNEIHNLISLDEVKRFLRVTNDTDNILIQELLEAALFYLENYVCKTLIQKTYEKECLQSDNLKITLIHAPIVEIISVESSDGKKINHSYDRNLVMFFEKLHDPIKIKYVAGLFKDSIPSIFKIALMEVISYLYNSDFSQDNLNTILNNFNCLKQYKL